MRQPVRHRDDRAPAGWTAGVLFDALVPILIGVALLVFMILVFLLSSGRLD